MPLLLLHAAATWAMTGIIWFVQVVHYPLFDRVGLEGFARYELAHSSRTTMVVAPLMLVELACAAWLALARPTAVPAAAAWLGAALVALIWVSTFALQVPQHSVLSSGFDTQAHGLLVATNWVRTVAWSLRAILALWMIAAAAAGR
jgi:hypothetical protein